MNSFSLLGIVVLILANVFLSPGGFEDVRVGFGGLNSIKQSHLLDITDLYQSDNYNLDSKDEENPRYSVLSVRPDKTAYLNATGSSVRGLWDYTTAGGDNLIIMANKDTVFKSSGTLWTTLEAGLQDSPWETTFYNLPNINRLYMCNGLDNNRKFFSGLTTLEVMQNQDDETLTGGTMYFTNNSIVASGDATAISSLAVGQYVKGKTTEDDDSWGEIVDITGTVVTFSTLYPGITEVSTQAVRSNNLGVSRHMIQYSGHTVCGYTDVSNEVLVSVDNYLPDASFYRLGSIKVGTLEAFEASAYGIAQKFYGINKSMSGARLYMKRSIGTAGNIIVKIKSSINSTGYLAKVIYPIASLSQNYQWINFNFGVIKTTIGDPYWITVEREAPDTSYFQVALSGAIDSNFPSYYTYNPSGFNSSWSSGLTTFEVTPDATTAYLGASVPDLDTYISSAQPGGNYSQYSGMFIGSVGGPIRKGIIGVFIDMWTVKYDTTILGATTLGWNNVKLNLYKFGASSGEVRVSQINASAPYGRTPLLGMDTVTWNSSGGGNSWSLAGCSLPGTTEAEDFNTNYSTVEAVPTTEGWHVVDLTSMGHNLITQDAYGPLGLSVVISGESDIIPALITFYTSNNTAYQPYWSLTTVTGTSESHVLAFQVISEKANSSTVTYSKRYHPENFPTLNTFQVPGTIVGLAETGGYLVVGTVKPDALHFYSETNDPTNGLGIDFVTSINGLTFGGGSHSIAYLPKGAGIIFYSGLGVYLQNGLSTTLLSGQIREEAKKMSAYRSPLDYYGGFADAMPQAIVDVTKDTYRLAVPNDKGQNSYIYNYNYGNSTWTRWTNLYPTAMLYRPETGSEPTTYFGNVSGEVYAINKTGSVNTGAELSWFFSGKDISKIKNLNTINIMVRKDNPLIGCVATLEITSPDSVGDIVITKNLTDNTTKDAMERLVYLPNINAREFKIKLTQSSSQGAVGIRAIQYKGAVKGDY